MTTPPRFLPEGSPPSHERGRVSIATADLASPINRAHAEAILKDIDEALLEEAEAGLRHQSRPLTITCCSWRRAGLGYC